MITISKIEIEASAFLLFVLNVEIRRSEDNEIVWDR